MFVKKSFCHVSKIRAQSGGAFHYSTLQQISGIFCKDYVGIHTLSLDLYYVDAGICRMMVQSETQNILIT